MNLAKSDLPFEERRQAFHESYGNEFDAGWTLVELVKGCGEFLAQIVGKDQALLGMQELTSSLTAEKFRSIDEWGNAVSESGSDAFAEWPLGEKLHDLTAYALYGIIFCDEADANARRAYLEALITDVKAFRARAPLSLWLDHEANGPRSELDLLIMLATNRWALDNNRSIEPAALAYFGGIAEGSIRNMMSGTNSTLTNVDGKVSAFEALTWLNGRESFWNSIWTEPSPLNDAPDEREELTAPQFVPVARDGSIFHPGLKRRSGFIIGKKGDEDHIESFERALRKLQAMPVAYWRRPNDKGVPGIVRGIRWARVDTSILEQAAATPGFQLPDSFG